MVTPLFDRIDRRTERAIVWVLAGLSGVVAALAGAKPTGTSGWDQLLTFLVVALAVLAASRAVRWPVIVVAAVASAASGTTAWAIAAWLAFAISLGGAALPRRSRIVNALASGLSLAALVRLPSVGFFGLQSVIAGVAIALLLITGYRQAPSGARGVARWAGLAVLLGSIVVFLIGGLAFLSARSDVERGIASANRGLNSARRGDTTAVVDELGQAEAALKAASDRVGQPWLEPIRLFPIAAQHLTAVRAASDEGVAVARSAGALVTEADLESVTLRQGSVDLSALESTEPLLESAARSLTDASVRLAAIEDDWLLPVLTDRLDELRAEVDSVVPETTLAADAARVVPGLLGGKRTMRYMLLFGTPGESREFGGFIGSWAILEAAGGRLAITDSGRIGRLYERTRASVIDPGTVPPWFIEMARPTQWPQNLTSSPAFDIIAAAGSQIFDGLTEEPLDGFMYIDTWALIDMLELSGPVEIPFQSEPLSIDNAPDFLFRDQYLIEENRTEVFNRLAEVATAVVARLQQIELPGPEELGRILGPSARAGRLQVITFDEEANEFLRSVKLLRDFPAPVTQDFVGLIQTNATSSKLDIYLQRDVTYDVAVSADGGVSARLAVELSSVVPGDAPQYTVGRNTNGGENRLLFSVYTPFVVQRIQVDGVEVPKVVAEEFEIARHLVDVTVPPDGTPVLLEFELLGSVGIDAVYDLTVWHQPLVNDDEVAISYIGPEGQFGLETALRENLIFDVAALSSGG